MFGIETVLMLCVLGAPCNGDSCQVNVLVAIVAPAERAREFVKSKPARRLGKAFLKKRLARKTFNALAPPYPRKVIRRQLGFCS